MNRCIINFAKGAWYPRGQARLLRSLNHVGFMDPVYAWKDEAQLPCASHTTIPYAFKVAAFSLAAAAGHDLILWCDAAVWAVKPMDPLFEHIEKHGHIFFAGGWNCAQWTSDRCLKAMSVSRDDAEKMPMYMACCMGLNLKHPRSQEFLAKLSLCADYEHFNGAWTNNQHEISNDPRCLGHRHDQSVGSILASQLGMEQTVGHHTFFSYYNNKAGVPYRYGEANDMEGIKDTVVLLSQGM